MGDIRKDRTIIEGQVLNTRPERSNESGLRLTLDHVAFEFEWRDYYRAIISSVAVINGVTCYFYLIDIALFVSFRKIILLTQFNSILR